jgi:hypothetical protein
MHEIPWLRVTTEWGRIGNIWWTNSEPSIHQDPYSRRLCVEWGAIIFGEPSPGHRYGEIIYL